MTLAISVIIPAVNEEAFLPRCLGPLNQQSDVEIIVADGGSTDNTAQIARASGASVVASRVKSRAAQMNAGARSARHDWLYFVHADTIVPLTFQADIASAIRRGYASGCYRFRFDDNRGLRAVNSWFTRFPWLTVRGGDQSLFVSRSDFDALGGFNEHYTIMEEYDFIRRLRKAGKSFTVMPGEVIVSARKYETNSWWRVQMANARAMWMFRQGRHPEEIRKMYRSCLNYRQESY
jgi:rSAM/selenodomain-associated transferase 2